MNLLPGWFPSGAVIGRELFPLAVHLFGDGNTSSPGNTFSFNGPFGEAHPNRQIAVLVQGTNANNSTNGTTTSVQVGGVTATRIYNPDDGQVVHWTLWLTPRTKNGGPAGASGNIVLGRSIGNGFTTFTGFEAFALYHLADPTDAFDARRDLSGNPAAVAINLALDGVLVCMGRNFGNTGNGVWTGATEVDEQLGGVSDAVRFGAAMENATGGVTGQAVTFDNGALNSGLLAASFR